MSRRESRMSWTDQAMSGSQAARDGLDIKRTVNRLGEQLRLQFSEVASEPLPEAMLALLEKLNRAAE